MDSLAIYVALKSSIILYYLNLHLINLCELVQVSTMTYRKIKRPGSAVKEIPDFFMNPGRAPAPAAHTSEVMQIFHQLFRC